MADKKPIKLQPGLFGPTPTIDTPSDKVYRTPEELEAINNKDDLLPWVFTWPPPVPRPLGCGPPVRPPPVRQPHDSSATMDKNTPVTPHQNRIPPPEHTSCPPFQDFCGLTATKTGSAELSCFYTLDTDARFLEKDNQLTEISKKEGGSMALRKLMKPGLAAVQLIVRYHPDAQEKSAYLSGFRLRHNGTDVVVTCSHFLQWPTVQEEFDKIAKGYITMSGSEAGIATQAMTVEPGVAMRNQFSLQLVAVHRPWDLAIFRIIDKPEDDEWNEAVDSQNLYFVAKEDRVELGQVDLWWSVGYNLKSNEAGFQTSWEWFWGRQPGKVRDEIAAKYGYDGVSMPSNQVLKPNQRTVCFGTLDEKASTGFPGVANRVSLNLSAWHGRSGSMVCTRPAAEVREREGLSDDFVYVCGVVVGGMAKSDHNAMVLFTTEMRDWFLKALDPSDDFKVNDTEFHQRFVMALDSEGAMSNAGASTN